MNVNYAEMTDRQLNAVIARMEKDERAQRAKVRKMREEQRGMFGPSEAEVRKANDRVAVIMSNINRAKGVKAARAAGRTPDPSTQWGREDTPVREKKSGAEAKKKKKTTKGVGARCKVGNRKGVCRDRSKAKSGEGFHKGKCPGPRQVQCYIDPSEGEVPEQTRPKRGSRPKTAPAQDQTASYDEEKSVASGAGEFLTGLVTPLVAAVGVFSLVFVLKKKGALQAITA